MAPAGPAGGGSAFRADIEGLRAVAVVLVVLGHAGVTAFAGGYVGVDVFFVISGFLITSLLAKELTRTGRISISRFYARRAVRLLPASSLALVATLAAAWLWMSPLRFTEFARDALASAGYVINIRLAFTGTDYLAADATPSPFQHFWSLAVEEQFYLLWPLLMVVAAAAGRRWCRLRARFWERAAGGHRVRPIPWNPDRIAVAAVAAALSVLTVGSFLLSIVETQRSAPWAYFGAHTRAWELGLGAMVALATGLLGRLPSAVSVALTWTGLAGIGTAALLFDETTAFPGAVAALPVVATALVIAGGCGRPRRGAEWLLRRRPFQVVGKLSYGWYLWHWPVLLIAPEALQLDLGVPGNLAIAVASLGLAWISLHVVENPVRRRRTLRSKPVRGIGMGLSLSISTAVAAIVVAGMPPTVPVGDSVVDLGAALGKASDPRAVLAEVVARGGAQGPVPKNLTPALTAAADDMPVTYNDGCHQSVRSIKLPESCEYGDATSKATVVLFGDSHAAQWFPALERLATTEHWELVSLTKGGCPAAAVRVWNGQLRRAYRECDVWRKLALARIERLAPELVVVSSYVEYSSLSTGAPADWAERWAAGWTQTLTALRGSAQRVVMVADTPALSSDAPQCVARNVNQVERCAEQASVVLRAPELRAAAAEQARQRNVPVIYPARWLCATTCPVVLGNLLVYRDAHHITTVFSEVLAPLLAAELKLPPLN